MFKWRVSFLILTLMTATACGNAQSFRSATEECSNCTEQEANAPVGEEEEINPPVIDKQTYYFPAYSETFGISQSIFEKAQRYYDAHWGSLGNTRYVTLINLGKRSNQKRFVVLDLATGKVERHVTSHGKGSDLDNDGYATRFSNQPGSNMSSLGFYLTGATYNGAHGRSLRLHGQDSTNSNAFSRAIVVHGADYISDSQSYAGRSLGCPALDNSVVQSVIDKILGGSLMLIENEP